MDLHKINFWKRLEMFAKNVQVNDAMSEEEKEMIVRIAQDQQKLNIASVSGKRPYYAILEELTVALINSGDSGDKVIFNETVKRLRVLLSNQLSAACASGAVDTVAARGHVHKWHETSSKERVCYMCGESEKTGAGSSHEGQP